MTPVLAPQPGDFVCLHTPGWAGQAIRLGTRSAYNHVAILVGPNRLIEARPGGAGITTLDRYASTPAYWSSARWPLDEAGQMRPLTDAERGQIVARALAFEGTPYNWTDVAALGLSSLGITPAPVLHRLKRRDTVFCSQLAAVAWRAAGLEIVPGKDPSLVTPGDCAATIAGQFIPDRY